MAKGREDDKKKVVKKAVKKAPVKKKPAKKKVVKKNGVIPPTSANYKRTPVDVEIRAARRPSGYCEEVQVKCDEYVADCPDAIPSIVGLAIYVGVVTKTLYNWSENENNTELLHTLSAIKDAQHHKALNGSIVGDLNPVISKLVLANHGYSDKQQTELTGADGGGLKVDYSVQFVGANLDGD